MSTDKKTKLIIGLGNPGKDYDNTRHNIGFAILDAFAFKRGLEFKKEKKFEAEIASSDFKLEYCLKKKKQEKTKDPELDCHVADAPRNDVVTRYIKVILAKPQTYMNDSGRAVSKLVKFYKIPAEDILVIHDDVTMDTGKLRMAFDRGAGGQHGVEDIIACLQDSKKFYRIKVGVGPDPGGDTRSDYVLSCFPKKEKELVDAMIDSSVDLSTKWLSEEDIQQIKTIKLES